MCFGALVQEIIYSSTVHRPIHTKVHFGVFSEPLAWSWLRF